MYIEQLEHIRADKVTPKVFYYQENILDRIFIDYKLFNVKKKVETFKSGEAEKVNRLRQGFYFYKIKRILFLVSLAKQLNL